MLQVRKELKLGLGIGAAIFGVAVVYGSLAMMTNKSGDQTAQSEAGGEAASVEGGNRPTLNLNEAVGGLPPREEPAAPEVKEPAVAPAVAQAGVDPFSESYRNDGSTSDPWATALRTGRISQPAAVNRPIVTETPSQPLVTPSIEIQPADTAIVQASNVTPPSAGMPIDFALPRDHVVPRAAGKYVVQPGDNFSVIAGRVYGNRNLYNAIAKANPNLDPTKLKPGMEIAVPDSETVKADRATPAGSGSLAKPADAAATLGTIDASKQYRIQPGDTLSRISQKLYGKTNRWVALYELNKGTIGNDPARLKVGTVLTLPQTPVR